MLIGYLSIVIQLFFSVVVDHRITTPPRLQMEKTNKMVSASELVAPCQRRDGNLTWTIDKRPLA